MGRDWKRELKEILKKNNMSEEYIEETVEYADDERMDEPVITGRFGRLRASIEDKKIDADVPSCWSNLICASISYSTKSAGRCL